MLVQTQPMTRAAVLEQLAQILSDVLGDKVSLNEETKAKDIDGWDSLNHAIFVAAVQKHFELRFQLADVINLKTVGDICDIVLDGINDK